MVGKRNRGTSILAMVLHRSRDGDVIIALKDPKRLSEPLVFVRECAEQQSLVHLILQIPQAASSSYPIPFSLLCLNLHDGHCRYDVSRD